MLIMSMKEKVDSQHYIWEQDQQRISLNYPVSLFSKTLLVILATHFIIDAVSAACCLPLCPPENSKGKGTVTSESARTDREVTGLWVCRRRTAHVPWSQSAQIDGLQSFLNSNS